MPKTHKELNEMFERADQALQSHFAEIRTNILLDIGHHHPKYDRFFGSRGTIFRNGGNQRKIRFVKNHIQVVTKYIRNSIQNRCPDGGIFPRNEKELDDQKSAQLNQSVYEYLKDQNDLTSVYSKIIQDFVVSGETYTKVFWDPNAGPLVGWKTIDEDDDYLTDNPDSEEPEGVEGEDDDDDEGEGYQRRIDDIRERRKNHQVPVFQGAIVYERIPAYNLITDPDADSQRTNSFMGIKKYFPRKKLLERYRGNPKKVAIIEKSSEQKQSWFDGFTGMYSDQGENEVELRELYFPVSEEYPEGYFYYFTDAGLLEKGVLPDGFCIFGDVYDESPENPRGYSQIKQARPYQLEINRCAAAVIMESITLGHSTVLYPAGEKPTTQAIGNGMKGLAYHSVQAPTVIEGRSGDQYIDYMNQQTDELYKVCNVPQEDDDKPAAGQNDSFAMLGRAIRDKMRFSLYGEKVEAIIIKIIAYSLKLARRYLPEDVLIPIVGKTEYVNIAEFKNTKPQEFMIRIKPRSDDFTSTYGKSIQIAQVMQYLGNQLPPEALASMIRKLPFLSGEMILKDYTIMEDQANYVILALDRGEIPFFFERANHDYLITRLSARMNEPDFPLLSPQIQMNYNDRLQIHNEVMLQQEQDAKAAAAGFIPSGGGLISVDFYLTGPEGKQQRAKLPYESVKWLVDALARQGTEVEKISNLPMASQAELGQMNMKGQQQPPPAPGMAAGGNVLPFAQEAPNGIRR